MINNEIVGVGIVTYNRKDSYAKLVDALKSCQAIDYVVTVKNFEIDYGENAPCKICNGKNGCQELASFQVNEKLGIGHNKNIALKFLMEKNAQHIFIVEDDILLKDINVFTEYISTAKEFSLQHLNFCRAFDGMTGNGFLKPFATISGNIKKLDIFNRLCGDFSYFTREAIEKGGLYDERYINALEHCEHTYRMSVLGMYTPFNAFADIADSTKYIEDGGQHTTISHDADYQANVMNAVNRFCKTYGKKLSSIPRPSMQDVIEFLRAKMS